MKMKKFIVFILLITLFVSKIFCQQNDEVQNLEQNIAAEMEEKDEAKKESFMEGGFFNHLDFFFGLTPTVYINTDSGTSSAASPIFVPVYVGVAWPDNTFISFQPALKFFMNYYLVNDDSVMPAEVENRTATALSFLLDLPIAFTLDLDFIHVGRIQAQAGIAALLRFGLLSTDVKPEDSGYYGNAAADLDYINSWFFGKMRFLYLSGGINWLFTYEKVKYGPEVSLYLPIAGFFADKSMNGIIFSAGLKFLF